MDITAFTHMIRHAASQGDIAKPFFYGHISVYDATQHRVRCIIPSMTDEDGSPLLSPWMPLGTLSSGTGYGIQIVPYGGASASNPTAGEQVLIAFFERQHGVSAVPCMFYHGTFRPPSTNLPVDPPNEYNIGAEPVVPGDVIIATKAVQPGMPNSFFRMRQNGNIEIWAAGTLMADVIGNINLTSNGGDLSIDLQQGNATVNVENGNATVKASGTIDIIAGAIRLCTSIGDDLFRLCTDRFRTIFNGHTHPNNGFPVPQADDTTVTSIVTAE